MSNYTKTTDFEAKDSLPTGDSGKIIRGAEFETEFDAVSTAIATKADTAGPTFTGTLTFATISDGTIGVTAFVDEDNMSSNSATLVPTQQSVKAYVDAQVTAQDLDFQADSGGALSIDLDSEALTFTGGTGVDTSGSGNAVTFAIDSTVATLTGTQTLTNKTLTSPDVNTPDIDGGTIDGTVIGGATPAAVSATTVSATGNITVGGTVDGRDVATDGTKLDGIEASATADQTAAEIRTLVESASDSNVFTDADHSKLNAIEASADVTDTANVTSAGALMDSELASIADVKALDQSVVSGATPTFTTTNFTDATNKRLMTDAQETKLDSVESSATADQTDAEIRAAVEAATDSNVFTDADHTKLNAIEASADVTDTANVTAAGALMDSELTSIASVKALNQGVATTDSPTFAGLTTTADVSFGDNDKAIFGAGSDLQIYHDSASNHSIIAESGSGSLFIRGQAITMQNADGSKAYFGGSGDVATAYYGTSAKLATTSTGIDVTGTVTADGLTVDASNSTFNGAIGITSAAGAGISEGLLIDYSTNLARFLTYDSSTGSELAMYTQPSGGSTKQRFRIDSNGNISFYEDTGTTAKLFWDASAESLGIGTSSPSSKLHVANAATEEYIFETTNNNTRSQVEIKSKDSSGNAVQTRIGSIGDGVYGMLYTFTNHNLSFATNNAAPQMTLDTSGNVGIGTSSPSSKLSVSNAGAGGLEISPSYSGTRNLVINYNRSASAYTGVDFDATDYIFYGSGSEHMRIDSAGNVGIGVTPENSSGTWRNLEQGGMNLAGRSAGGVDGMVGTNYVFKTDNSEVYKYTAGTSRLFFDANEITFQQAASGTAGTAISWSEAMRIASDGSISTPTSGTSNVRFGVNAGNSIVSGGNFNTVVGDEAGTAITTGDNNTFLGYASGDAIDTATNNTAIGHNALTADTKGSHSVAIGKGTLANQNFTSATDAYNTVVGSSAGNDVTTGVQNTLIGGLAGTSLTDADENVAVGIGALDADTLGSKSVAIGASALSEQNFTSATDTYNVGVGYFAGRNVTTGIQNVIVGGLAGDALTDADYNVALGTSSLGANTVGSRNTALGHAALFAMNPSSATDTYNTAIGFHAGLAVTTGIQNTLIGGLAGDALTDADNTTAIGYQALKANTTGGNNTAVGKDAGLTVTTGENNTYIGFGAGPNSSTGTGNLNTTLGFLSGNAITSGAKNTIIGAFTGNQNSLDIRTSSNNIVLSDGDGKVRYHSVSDNDTRFHHQVSSKLVTYAKSVSISASSTTDLITFTQDGYAMMLMGKLHIMFVDGSYQNGNVSIIGNLAAHTSDNLATLLKDYNVVDTALVQNGGISFTTAAVATKTAGNRDGVLKIQATTDANTTGNAFIIFDGHVDSFAIS